MPQRFLKPGITTSRRWESCSWRAQSFYIRIITLVDDYGRYDADFMLLRSHCFPVREDIKSDDVESMSKELSDSGLAVFYKKDGKQYLQLLNWTERARSEHSRFPECDNTCEQMFSPPAESCALLRNPASLVPRSSSSPIVHRPSPFGLRVGGWFGRREETKWSDKEMKALAVVESLETPDEDMATLEAFYTHDHPRGADYRRRNIITLLNNWPGEIDRAKRWQKQNGGIDHDKGFFHGIPE